MGEPRDFKFGTLNYHSKSHPADENLPNIQAYSDLPAVDILYFIHKVAAEMWPLATIFV